MIHIPPQSPLADLRVIRVVRVNTINNQSSVIIHQTLFPHKVRLRTYVSSVVNFLFIDVHYSLIAYFIGAHQLRSVW